jgi:hypothetical protein
MVDAKDVIRYRGNYAVKKKAEPDFDRLRFRSIRHKIVRAIEVLPDLAPHLAGRIL